MRTIGRRSVGCFNARYRRTGTLWEGRFKAALVGGDRCLSTRCRCIEPNPARAGMAADPRHHQWSSHRSDAHGADEARIAPHPCYLALGNSPLKRQTAYLALFEHLVSHEGTEAVRTHTQQQRALGSERFRAQVEALTQRTATVRPRAGRLRWVNEPEPFFRTLSDPHKMKLFASTSSGSTHWAAIACERPSKQLNRPAGPTQIGRLSRI